MEKPIPEEFWGNFRTFFLRPEMYGIKNINDEHLDFRKDAVTRSCLSVAISFANKRFGYDENRTITYVLETMDFEGSFKPAEIEFIKSYANQIEKECFNLDFWKYWPFKET